MAQVKSSCSISELNDVAKTQSVRLLDVVLIGPLMIWGGSKAGGAGGALLAVFGVTTILYNANNYLRLEKAKR